MSESTTQSSSAVEFAELISRIRAGDEAAAETLVRRYEPIIRREVRLALIDPRLSRLFDSIDVSQSVFASFFLHGARHQFDLDCPAQLVALLLKMARNKLASRNRDAKRQKRDLRRIHNATERSLVELQSADMDPSEQVASQELIEKIRGNLAPEELQLMDLRRDGHSWAAIAEKIGGTAQARRVQLMRALKAAWEQTAEDPD